MNSEKAPRSALHDWKQQKLELLVNMMEKGNIKAVQTAVDEIKTMFEAEDLVHRLKVKIHEDQQSKT